MAMIKLGDGITDINGRVKGDVFRYDQCGHHWQALPRHVRKEPTPDQRKRRQAWRECHDFIREHFTFNHVAAWSAYGHDHPSQNKKGELIELSWACYFFRINIVRLVNDLEILEYPPGYEPPEG